MRTGQAAHRFRLHQPVVGDHEVQVGWDLTPASGLYRADGFRFTFPPELDPQRVPDSLWLRLAIICLHPHWALLRPCRIELPVYIGPAEREFWLRMIDTAAFQIEAYGGERRPGRAAELRDEGRPLPPAQAPVGLGRAAASFSGGKDSLAQAGLLAELVERPLLVATTSPVEWAHDHVGDARARTLREIQQRLPVGLVEVFSDFRACWDNGFAAGEGCVMTVNELTDVLLYQATTVAAAAAAGIARCFMASEADVQYNAPATGNVLQHGHFTAAAVTHATLDRLLRGYGMRLGSLTYPLHTQHVMALLWRRYPELTDLQFSCWEAADGSQACGQCRQCIEIALLILGEGASPSRAGINPATVLHAWREPRPPEPYALRAPQLHPRRVARDKTTRVLQALPVEEVAQILGSDPAVGDRLAEAVDGYRAVRERAMAARPLPDPGYVDGFLEFIDDDLRDPLREIFDRYFTPADDPELVRMVSRSRSLAAWIADPLTRAVR